MKQTYFKIPGWFNYSETYDVIADEIADDGKIVEIGSFLGRSTHYLATALVNANKENVKIYCVDTFEGSTEHANIKLPKDFSEIFKENLRYFIGRNVVTVCQGRSDEKIMSDGCVKCGCMCHCCSTCMCECAICEHEEETNEDSSS